MGHKPLRTNLLARNPERSAEPRPGKAVHLRRIGLTLDALDCIDVQPAASATSRVLILRSILARRNGVRLPGTGARCAKEHNNYSPNTARYLGTFPALAH